jgi:hypothetical protein
MSVGEGANQDIDARRADMKHKKSIADIAL